MHVQCPNAAACSEVHRLSVNVASLLISLLIFVAHQNHTEDGLVINVRLTCKKSKSVGAKAGATKGGARKPANTVRSSGLGLQPQVGAAHEHVGCVRNA